MRIDLLVLGSRELSGVISVVLKLANSCFPTMSSRLSFLEDFANEEQANKQGVCCFQADHF